MTAIRASAALLCAALWACEAAPPAGEGATAAESTPAPGSAASPAPSGSMGPGVAVTPNAPALVPTVMPTPAQPPCLLDGSCEPGCSDVDCDPASGGVSPLPAATGGAPAPLVTAPGGAGMGGAVTAPANGGAMNGGTSSGGSDNGGAAVGGSADAGAANGGAPGLAGTGNGTAGMASGGGSGGSPSVSCPATALFCEDFEASASLPGSLVVRVNGDGTVAVDDSVAAHSGVRSVRVDATGYQTFFALAGAPTFPVAGGALYLRLYLRLSEAMTSGHNTYFEAGPEGETDAQYETRVGVMQNMLMINQPAGDRGFLANQNYYNDALIGAHLDAATWGCIETYFDPMASEIRVWLDEVEIADLHRTDWQQDPIGEIRFGYEKYAGPNTQLWFDDIVVSGEPIGCD